MSEPSPVPEGAVAEPAFETIDDIPVERVACSVCGADEADSCARAKDYIYHGSNTYFVHVQCRSCGHVYLNPRPRPEAIGTMYPTNYGTRSGGFSDRRNVLTTVKNAVIWRRFRSVASDLGRGSRILDVGCGDGELLRCVAENRPDLELFGLDWTFSDEARSKLEAHGVQLIEQTLEAADLPADHFDLIILNQLIEHLWDPDGGLRRLAAALRPGGRISIETPNTDGYDRRFFRSGKWGGYYVPRHLNLYNFERLERVLLAAGLQVVSQRNLPAPIIWCYSFRAMLQERLGRPTFAEALFDLRNIPLLAGFAALDTLSSAFGLKTSNQQTVAVRPA